MPDERDIQLPSKEDTKSAYDAEFEGTKPTPLALRPEDVAQEIKSLLGPSQRQVIQRIDIEFRRKIHELEDEVGEMMEREIALKEQIRKTSDQNEKLGKERDAWRAKSDPAGDISRLTEELAQSVAKHEGWEKIVAEQKHRIDDLVRQVEEGNNRRKELHDQLTEQYAQVAILKGVGAPP